MNIILERIHANPIIAALKNTDDLEDVIKSQVNVVFLLHADIFNIDYLVNTIKDSGKSVLIHLDFLEGIGRDNKAIDYIAQKIKPDGIISTKSNHIKYAKENGMFAIQRFFLIDSLSYHTLIKSVQSLQPDMIEILPGVMPSVLSKITSQLEMPVIAGGLISSKEDIITVLNSGVQGVSTGKKELWMA